MHVLSVHTSILCSGVAIHISIHLEAGVLHSCRGSVSAQQRGIGRMTVVDYSLQPLACWTRTTAVPTNEKPRSHRLILLRLPMSPSSKSCADARMALLISARTNAVLVVEVAHGSELRSVPASKGHALFGFLLLARFEDLGQVHVWLRYGHIRRGCTIRGLLGNRSGSGKQ